MREYLTMSPAAASEINLDHCEVVTVRATDPHRLVLRFRDGLVAELDFSDIIAGAPRPVVLPLRDPGYFATATLDDGVLTWPNGYDIDPVTLRGWAERGYCA
jgi:hypothetical protein